MLGPRHHTQGEAATTAYTNGQLDQAAFNTAVNRITDLRASLF